MSSLVLKELREWAIEEKKFVYKYIQHNRAMFGRYEAMVDLEYELYKPEIKYGKNLDDQHATD